MPNLSLKRFTELGLLQTIAPAQLRELLAPHRPFLARRGLHLVDDAEPPGIDYDLLRNVLLTPDVDTPKELANALYFVHELSTPAGMDALLRAVPAEDLGLSHFLECSPADVAVRVWLRDPELLQRVHAEQAARESRIFEYYQTRVSPPPPFKPPTADQVEGLEQVLDQVFASRNRGRGVRVLPIPAENDCLFLVRHGDAYKREGTLQGVEASSVLYRPMKFDTLVYDRRSGTLRIHADARWQYTLYHQQFGKYVFWGMDCFCKLGRYTLEPLRRGESSLDCPEVARISYVVLTSVHVLVGGEYNELKVHKADNVFAVMKRDGVSFPPASKLVRATFAVRFRGLREFRNFTIKPPLQAHFARDEDAEDIEQWLSLRGFNRSPKEMVHDANAQGVLARA